MSELELITKNVQLRREKLEGCLASITGQLKALGALKVILFGSLASDEVDVTSDLDLFIVMPNTKSGMEWMGVVYGEIERDCAADMIVYNESEFEDMLPTSSFLKHVVETGKVVYEKSD